MSDKHMNQRPNIIFFMVDDLGWGDLGCYGHQTIQTPNLDKFASEGLLLTNCHSASPVCSPARAAMLTGRTPYRNGMYTINMPNRSIPHLRKEEITLPSLLKDHGYRTCHVGKWHLGEVEPDSLVPNPHDHGFDHWMATSHNAKPSHLNPVNFYRNGVPLGEIKGYSAGLIVEEAVSWIENLSDDPFFLTVWTHEPHTPLGTSSEFLELYSSDIPQKKREYYGNVSQIDHAFGLLMQHLERLNLKENTLVLFTSDNGPAWDKDAIQLGSTGGHRGGKAWMYEGGIRVPGLIRYPSLLPSGRISDAMVTGTDFFSTVLDLCGVTEPQDRTIDGESFLPLLQGKTLAERSKPLYWRYDGCDNDLKVAYQEGEYILLADSALDRCEMYHLPSDWQQSHDLVYDDFDRFARMKKKLVDIHESVENEGPDWWKLDPDPLIPWKRNHPEGITRFLLGKIPEAQPCPYPTANWPVI